MKLKNILMGVVATVGFNMMAHSETIVITGSSAYRANVDAALLHLGFTATAWITGKTSANGNAALYTGSGTYAGYLVKTSWSGSAAGIQTVAATSPTKTVGVFADTDTGALADPRSGGNQVRPDIAMADNTQASTKFNGTFLGTTYNALKKADVTPTVGSVKTSQSVGVVDFVWLLSKSAGQAPYSYTSDTLSMSSQIAQAILKGQGYVPLSLFTGNSTDTATSVYATGRDPDSGTRITTFAESAVGVNSVVQQWKPTIAAGVVTSIALYPASVINGVTVPLGEGGESSGGTVATNLSATGPAATAASSADGVGGFLVSYVGISDATTAISGGAIRLKYNGIPYSQDNIKNGYYTFWGYENLFYRSTQAADDITNSTHKVVFGNALASKIYNVDASIFITDMKVSRSFDGGVVTPN